MKAKKLVNLIFAFGLVLFLFTVMPMFTPVHEVFAADGTQEAKLNVNSKSIVKGQNFSLIVYNLGEGQSVSYRSNQTSVASVDSNGVVYGNSVGVATITVTIKDTSKYVKTLSCNITVGPAAVYVKFSESNLTMTVGQKITLQRILLPLNTVEAPKYSTSDSSVATVSTGGKVTAKSAGTATIYAKISCGGISSCKITVVDSSPTPSPILESSEDKSATAVQVEKSTVFSASDDSSDASAHADMAPAIDTAPSAPLATPSVSNDKSDISDSSDSSSSLEGSQEEELENVFKTAVEKKVSSAETNKNTEKNFSFVDFITRFIFNN